MSAAQATPELVINTAPALAPAATDWHALSPDDVMRLLDVNSTSGLTTSQVKPRQQRYGLNALQRIQARPAWRVLVDQFASIVIALLAIAAVIAWLMGDSAEAIAILVVLVLNAAVGFATEWQAGRALDALRRQSRTSSRVRRDGFETTVDAEELVPGDVIILNAGDRVPADARLLEAVRRAKLSAPSHFVRLYRAIITADILMLELDPKIDSRDRSLVPRVYPLRRCGCGPGKGARRKSRHDQAVARRSRPPQASP